MDTQNRLGRGLSSLIPDAATIEEEKELRKKNIQKLEVSKIKPNEFQPRKHFADKELLELSQSIRKHGVLQPVLVREKNGVYEIVAGERRWRAAQKAGLSHVPALIQNFQDHETLEIALIENIQRADLNCVEEATAYQRLIEQHHYTQSELAEKVGKDRSHIANTLRLLELPVNIQNSIIQGQISMGHARAILSFSSESERVQGLEVVLKKRLSVRETEQFIREKKAALLTQPQRAPEIRSTEELLRNIFKTKVMISNSAKNRGRIAIEFYSLSLIHI